jgi:hypothetical protein
VAAGVPEPEPLSAAKAAPAVPAVMAPAIATVATSFCIFLIGGSFLVGSPAESLLFFDWTGGIGPRHQ